ncbi:PREDICTED: cysteinyl leukotriene receptor 1 [Gekko japonicus]|uniref:Cysteinyl leukotriene receptor 1 n=1 Tax=Gekko japonicus TaxID=146911 RepID=A0ABM1L3S7_GEKJA|nr:PREDICTED: cysteinyl leukotriene receptor 1 [Gekko japonicus]
MLPYPMESIMAAEENSTSLSTPSPTCHDTIDEFRNHVYSTVYSIVTMVGFVGNGFVLCVLIRTYQDKTAFQVYMLNLAISDLLFVFTLPLRVVYYINNGNWFFGDFLCRITSYALYVNLYCSIFFMTAMSFFRCIAIAFPVQNIHFLTEKRARLTCVTIWIFVMLTSSPFLLRGSYEDPATNKTKCYEPPAPEMVLKLMVLHYIALLVGFIVPFVIITICCTVIIRALLKNSLHKKQEARRKAVWMVIIVTLAFLISFSPYHVQRTVHIHFLMRKGASCEDVLYMQKTVVISLSLAATNCCFDPLLYFFSGGNFRRRLSTFRKASASSGSQLHRMKLSSKNLDEEGSKEKMQEAVGSYPSSPLQNHSCDVTRS